MMTRPLRGSWLVRLGGALVLATGATALAQPAAPAPASAPVPASYFVLYDDGGEHLPEDCGVSTKLPGRLGKAAALKGRAGYLGSKQIEFAARNAAGIDAFSHYFSDAKSCRAALKKLAEMAES